MARALTFLVLTCLAVGCGDESKRSICDDESLCESALTISVTQEGGAFAPGVYTFDIEFDTLRTSEDCTVTAPPQTPTRCTGGLVTVVTEGLHVTAFQVKGPPAKRAAISLRQPCVARELAAQTFEPTYACATGCRRAAATMTVKSAAAFTICPDAGPG